MAQTVFSNDRKVFDTVLKGDAVTLIGEAIIGDVEFSFRGQISKNDNNDYVGDYYVGDYRQTNLSIADQSRMDYLIESATLLKQLSDDVATKQTEINA